MNYLMENQMEHRKPIKKKAKSSKENETYAAIG